MNKVPDSFEDANTENQSSPLHTSQNGFHAPFTAVAKLLVDAGVHPCRVTASKVPLSVLAVGMHQTSPLAGTLMFFLASSADILDGKVARMSGKTTQAGAVLDAYVDKLVNLALYAYLVSQFSTLEMLPEQILSFLMLINVLLDIFSQALRGNLVLQTRDCIHAVFSPHDLKISDSPVSEMANSAGKQKAWAQFLGIASLMASQHPVALTIAGISFSISTLLAGKSIAGRIQQTKKSSS